MYISKFFKDSEFLAVGCYRHQICDDSLCRLDKARKIAGIPFVLSSAFRDSASEIAKGRSGKGAHTLGRAFDIRCRNSSERWKIVFGALAAGFPRIGIASNFVHLDDSELSGPCIWLY